jgi:amino acid transporter
VSPLNAYIMNFTVSHPVLPLAAGLFFAFSAFPGGSFVVGGVLSIPIILCFTYAFGLLTSMIPRTGGDYTLVSRILHPALGLVSSFCMTMAQLMSAAFFGRLVVTEGLGPGLVGLGLIGHNPDLVNAGNTVVTNTLWTFVAGSLLYLSAAAILIGGWRWTLRWQNLLFVVVSAGLLTCVVIALLMSPADFITNFNNFAQPYTHNPDTYHAVIATAKGAGVPIGTGFSWSNTIPIIGVFATFSIFTYFSSFVGGELRQGRSIKTANTMALAGVTGVISIIIGAVIFINTFGTDFLTAAFSSSGLPQGIATSPTYFFLIGAAMGNTLLEAFLVITFMLFWPMLTYVVFIQPGRMLFAYAFDGLLPVSVTKLSKSHTPWVAVILTVVATELIFAWSLSNNSIFQVIVYATLIQLIAMALVGISAIVVPWRRPALYKASSSERSVLRIPIISIAGLGSVLATIFIWWLYLTNGGFGLTDSVGLWIWVIGLIVAALLFYVGARVVRARQGVNLDLVYAEIPPE